MLLENISRGCFHQKHRSKTRSQKKCCCAAAFKESSKGIATVSLESGVPVLFGVLTTENIEQAIERAGTKAGNKGYDCAVSAIEMVNLLREMDTAAE